MYMLRGEPKHTHTHTHTHTHGSHSGLVGATNSGLVGASASGRLLEEAKKKDQKRLATLLERGIVFAAACIYVTTGRANTVKLSNLNEVN